MNRRSGAVNRHERDVSMRCSSRSRAVDRRVLSSSRACRRQGAGVGSCVRQGFGRVRLELEQARVFLGERPLRLLQTLNGFGEMLIQLLDMSVLLTDCVLELDERVIQLPDMRIFLARPHASSFGELLIELPDVRIFLGDSLLEAQERAVQLTDVPVARFDFARGALAQFLAPTEDACDQLAHEPLRLARIRGFRGVDDAGGRRGVRGRRECAEKAAVVRRTQTRQRGSSVDSCREATPSLRGRPNRTHR